MESAQGSHGQDVAPAEHTGLLRSQLWRTIAAALVFLTLNIGLTGLFASWGHSFSSKEVRDRVLGRDAGAAEAVRAYEGDPERVRDDPPPLRMTGASHSPWSLALFLNMFALWLLLRPKQLVPRLHGHDAWLLAGLIGSLLIAITVAQSLLIPTYAEGRRVFTFASLDIDALSFGWQAFRLLLVSALLAALWVHRRDAIAISRKWLDRLERGTGADTSAEHAKVYARLGRELAVVFARFQLDSLLIIAAFAPLAWSYWLYIFPYGDLRYAVIAVVFYLLWFGTWAIVAAPLWHTAQRWLKQRFRLLETIAEDDAEDAERWLTIMQVGNPLTAGNLIGTTLIGLASVLPPLVGLWQ